MDLPENKKSGNFILSICIPTYNRAELLQMTLESIVKTKSFQSLKVEVVISDNTSPDNTEEIVRFFCSLYPDRIFYWKHTSPIDSHFNFEYALGMGHGKIIKLNNDNFPFADGSLDRLIQELEEYGEKYSIFFPEQHEMEFSENEKILSSVEEVIDKVSFDISAIHMLCLKRETYQQLQNPFRAWDRHFPHVDILFRLLNQGEQAVRISHIAMERQWVIYTRNQAREYAYNYISFLYEQKDMGKLSRKTLQKEKMRILFKLTIPVHFDFFHQFNVSRKPLPFWEHTVFYRKDWFFYVALVWIAFYWFTSNIIPIHQFLGKIKRKLLQFR